jgi:hypothetical protein
MVVPLIVLFGIGDGGGFLLGSAFHWSVSDSLSNVLQTTILVALGLYWIALAAYSKWAAKQELQRGPGYSCGWLSICVAIASAVLIGMA